MDDIEAFLQQRPRFRKRLRRLGLEEKRDLVGHFVDVIDLKRHRHPLFRAESVDQNRKCGDFARGQERLLDQQRLASAGRFHFAIGQRGDFQVGLDRFGDADEFARRFQLVREFAHGGESHFAL